MADKNTRQYIFVIRQLARRDVTRGNSSKFLGQIWNVINPFIHMITMVLVFSAIFENSIPNYRIYVLTGTIIYSLYNSGTTGAMKALVRNKRFLIRTRIPMNVFVIEKVYVAFIHMLYSLIGYVILLIIFQIPPNPCMLLVIPDIALSLVLIYGIGKILAVINVYFADIQYFYRILMVLFMYGSAIFYSADRLAPAVQAIINVNPIYISITMARNCVIGATCPNGIMWLTLACYAVGFYLLGSYVFKKGTQDVVAKL